MLGNSASGNFNLAVVVVVVVTRPLPRDGSMVEDHGTQKPDNSPWPGPEVVERQKIAKERAVQKVRGWTVQNEMIGVLGRVSARAARRILYSAKPREIGASET